MATGRRVDVLRGHEGHVRRVAWSPDGQFIATGSDDRTVRVWSARPDVDRLEADARGRVFRTLSEDERRRHMLAPPTA
ncbi:WD40 repeat domain-containing protein [Streptomyces sp. NBC_01508]|uniref:WD40 repeat domain-containing protein n=1 Tax=Streptomyces sp. NBC_01508 TaxID=2903888 RepID=UPI00387010C7